MDTSYRQSKQHIEDVRTLVVAQRKKWREDNHIPEPTDLLERESAEIDQEVIKIIGTQHRNTGTALLMMLWQFYVSGEYLFLEETQDFRAWADSVAPFMDDKYLMDLIHIIERVFVFAFSHRVVLDNNTRVTPELLIEKAGVSKLKIISPLIAEETDDSRKMEHIRAILDTARRDDVTEYVQTVRGSRTILKLPYNCVQRSDGKVDIHLVGLTADQSALFSMLLSRHGEALLDQPA